MILLRLAFQTCCASPNTNLTWGHLCSILRSFGCAEFLLLCRWDEIGMQGSYSDICMAFLYYVLSYDFLNTQQKLHKTNKEKAQFFFKVARIYIQTHIFLPYASLNRRGLGSFPSSQLQYVMLERNKLNWHSSSPSLSFCCCFLIANWYKKTFFSFI